MDSNQKEILTRLRRIDEYEFEHFVADLWKRYGWKTSVTSGSNDRGLDIVVKKGKPFHQKYYIQVKCWEKGNKIGGPEIREYSSLVHRDSDVDAVVVVTTSSFTQQAKSESRDLNVKIVDGNDLYETIIEVKAFDLVSEYTAMDGSSCPLCDETFQNESSLTNHLNKSHNYIKCPECGSLYRVKSLLHNHLLEDHNYKKCSECDRIFQNKKSMTGHLKRKHNYKTCSKCDILCQDKSALHNHLREDHNGEICPECDRFFKNEDSKRNHLREKHDYITCSECSDLVADEGALHSHLSEEHGYRECPNCKDIFKDKPTIDAHLREVHWGD